MWYDGWMIGDGERTTEEAAKPVYRSYEAECQIVVTEEVFYRIKPIYNIYFATQLLKNINFTPRDSIKQHTTNYYFAKLDVKFPRKN